MQEYENKLNDQRVHDEQIIADAQKLISHLEEEVTSTREEMQLRVHEATQKYNDECEGYESYKQEV